MLVYQRISMKELEKSYGPPVPGSRALRPVEVRSPLHWVLEHAASRPMQGVLREFAERELVRKKYVGVKY